MKIRFPVVITIKCIIVRPTNAIWILSYRKQYFHTYIILKVNRPLHSLIRSNTQYCFHLVPVTPILISLRPFSTVLYRCLYHPTFSISYLTSYRSGYHAYFSIPSRSIPRGHNHPLHRPVNNNRHTPYRVRIIIYYHYCITFRSALINKYLKKKKKTVFKPIALYEFARFRTSLRTSREFLHSYTTADYNILCVCVCTPIF